MPDFTITLSTKAVQRLQTVLQRYNDNQGTKLTIKQFLRLHLQEMAVADELAQATQTLTQQTQRDAEQTLQAAITTARDRLIQEL
jgi:hypothetical protein